MYFYYGSNLILSVFPSVLGEISLTDGVLETWEFVSTTMQIPSATDFLVVKIQSSENIFNDSSGTEFDGHYADSISLTIVPEPTTMALFGAGLIFLIRKRK